MDFPAIIRAVIISVLLTVICSPWLDTHDDDGHSNRHNLTEEETNNLVPSTNPPLPPPNIVLQQPNVFIRPEHVLQVTDDAEFVVVMPSLLLFGGNGKKRRAPQLRLNDSFFWLTTGGACDTDHIIESGSNSNQQQHQDDDERNVTTASYWMYPPRRRTLTSSTSIKFTFSSRQLQKALMLFPAQQLNNTNNATSNKTNTKPERVTACFFVYDSIANNSSNKISNITSQRTFRVNRGFFNGVTKLKSVTGGFGDTEFDVVTFEMNGHSSQYRRVVKNQDYVVMRTTVMPTPLPIFRSGSMRKTEALREYFRTLQRRWHADNITSYGTEISHCWMGLEGSNDSAVAAVYKPGVSMAFQAKLPTYGIYDVCYYDSASREWSFVTHKLVHPSSAIHGRAIHGDVSFAEDNLPLFLFVVFSLHTVFELLFCNEFVQMVQNDGELGRAVHAEWLVPPTRGRVLFLMISTLQTETGTFLSLLMYLLWRCVIVVGVLFSSFALGWALRNTVLPYVTLQFLLRYDGGGDDNSGSSSMLHEETEVPGYILMLSDMSMMAVDVILCMFVTYAVMQLEKLRFHKTPKPKEELSVDNNKEKEMTSDAEDKKEDEEEEEIACRICASDERPLFAYCECNGSIKYSHSECLETWRRQRGNAGFCEVCHVPYDLQAVPLNYSSPEFRSILSTAVATTARRMEVVVLGLHAMVYFTLLFGGCSLVAGMMVEDERPEPPASVVATALSMTAPEARSIDVIIYYTSLLLFRAGFLSATPVNDDAAEESLMWLMAVGWYYFIATWWEFVHAFISSRVVSFASCIRPILRRLFVRNMMTGALCYLFLVPLDDISVS
eukprot:PhM_4_TR18041/c0_g1_i5/m.97269